MKFFFKQLKFFCLFIWRWRLYRKPCCLSHYSWFEAGRGSTSPANCSFTDLHCSSMATTSFSKRPWSQIYSNKNESWTTSGQ